MKRTASILLLGLLLGAAAGPATAVIDPFYRNRMDAGVRAFEQGDWQTAARQLRIACFGHLDEPVALVEGLVRLAVVQVRLGEEDSFRQTFGRLVELEQKFSAYSAARVPAAVQQQFEELAARLVSSQVLQTAAGFEAIANRAELGRLASLPVEQRRAELESRLRVEPEREDWLIELVRLELANRRPRPALAWLDRLPAASAGTPPALCLRQQAASEAGDCSRAHLDRPFCRDVPGEVVEFHLHCLVEAGRWSEAAGLVGGLDPVLRSRRRVARLERRVRSNLGEEGFAEAVAAAPAAIQLPAATTEPEVRVAAPMPAAAPAADAPATPAAEPSAARRTRELRQRLAAATTAAKLEALMGEAEALADRFPGYRGARLLAAELAYLRSDWPRAVDHFRRAGDLRANEVDLAFYRAVALYESGDRAAAAEILRPVAAQLERSSFVDAYVDRILAPGI